MLMRGSAEATPLSLLLALAGAAAIVAAARPPRRITRPPVMFGLVAGVASVGGVVSYYATHLLFPEYNVSMEYALVLAAMGFGVMAAGIWLWRFVPERPNATEWTWDVARLDLLITVMIVATVIGTIGAVQRIGYVPALRGALALDERTTYELQGGVFFRLSMLGVPAAILAGTRWMAFGRTRAAILHVLIGTISVSLYGPRFFPIVIVAVLVTLYDVLRKPLSVWRVGLIAIIGIPLLIAFGIYRQATEVDDPVATFGRFTFLEFRDYAWSIDYFAEPARRLNGETIPSMIVPLLPGKLWALAGVDKASIFARNSASIMSDVLDANTGIRVGVLGELYMNYGPLGIALGMFLLGLLVGWFDRRLRASSIRHATAPFWALASVIAVFSIVGQLNMFTSTLNSFGLPLLAAALIAARRIRDESSVAHAAPLPRTAEGL